MKKGSITVFAALTFMLIAQMLLVLIEGCRHMELGKVADMNTDAVAESMLAEYVRPMWEEYHLLTNCTGTIGSELGMEEWTTSMKSFTASGYSSGLLKMTLQKVDYPQYTLLTDGNGKVYIQTVAAYMKHNLLYEGAKKVYGSYEALESLKNQNSFDFGAITEAIESIQTAGEAGKTRPTPAPGAGESGTPAISEADRKKAEKGQNILTVVKELYTTGVLKLVLPENSGISEASVEKAQLVSKRSLAQGKNPEIPEVEWLEQVMLQQYLLGYFADYCQNAERESAFYYELEYLMEGKASDKENLTLVAEELLAVREAANMLYLTTNPQKKAEVLAMAELIAGVTMNPVIVEVTKVGLMAAWAFAESVIDVRTLLAGGKVPLTKSDLTWVSSLEKIPELLTSSVTGGESGAAGKSGLDYRSYLSILLFARSAEKLAMRAMDLQEMRIRTIENYSDFAMDHCICSAKCAMTYAFDPLLLPISGTIERETEVSYLKGTGS